MKETLLLQQHTAVECLVAIQILLNFFNYMFKFNLTSVSFLLKSFSYSNIKKKTQILIKQIATYSLFFTSNLLIKSFPSSETLAKASSSKSQSHAFTFFRVSISFSPANGDRPLNLKARTKVTNIYK